MVIKTVKTTGGDYTTLQAAFDYIETQSPLTEAYTIEIYNNTNEVGQLSISAVTTETNKIRVVGIGSTKPIINLGGSGSPANGNFLTSYLEFENLVINPNSNGGFYREANDSYLSGTHKYNKMQFNASPGEGYFSFADTNTLEFDFTNCVFKSGINFDGYTTRNIIIKNNTFYDATNIPLAVSWYGDNGVIDIRNNILYNSASENQIIVVDCYGTGTTVTLNKNLYYNNAYSPFYYYNGTNYDNFNDFKTASGETGYNQNPLLTNVTGGDFSLTSSSPAIDVGVNTGLSTDFIGTTRPQGSAYDIGAYEYAFAQVDTPTINPSGGTFSSPQTVSMSCTTSGADIYYTVNGSTPTSASTLYTSSFSVSTSELIKAIAIADGYTDSEIASANFIIEEAPMSVILESLFSELASQFVPGSIYAPKAPVLTSVEDHQKRAGSTQGFVKLNWTAIVNNEKNTEALVVADGGLQHVETLNAPIVAGTYSVSAATETGSAYATTLSASAAKGATSFDVVDGGVFSVGDWIVLESSHTDVRKKELLKIDTISTNTIGIGTSKPEGLLIDHESGATAEAVTLVEKTETTDYIVTDASLGEITLVSGQFTAGDYVFITYTSENTDFANYKVYRNTSDDFTTASFITTIDGQSTETAELEHVGQADEGETFFYWVTAIDNNDNESRPAKAENSGCATHDFDTIPTRPLHPYTTTTLDRITIIWDGTLAGNSNLDGYSVYRKANNSTNFDTTSTEITTALVVDVPTSEVKFEDTNVETGTTYYYKITAIQSASTNNTSGSTRQGNVTAGEETRTVKEF